MASSSTVVTDLGKPQFESHKWIEPIIVISIMIASLILNRDRDLEISRGKPRLQDRPLLQDDSDSDDLDLDSSQTLSIHPASSDQKSRRYCCCIIKTPNTSRFRNHLHSQILQKFPFLIEMFYWALNYGVYSFTKSLAEDFYAGKSDDVAELAQSHGISVLRFERESFAKFLFPIQEVDIQGFFLNGHTSAMTFLNRVYSLVHIPATVLFLSWYYHAAPTHSTFATARRTMSLANFFAFFIFIIWPCMPPRLLPPSFGFHDTVRQSKAESVWVGGKNVNQLAAMPSLHFTYAFIIGCTFLYHPRRQVRVGWKLGFIVAGIVYPLFVILVIVATANHYFLDAVVATGTVGLSFLGNRVWFFLVPAEDWLCWVLRVEKPVPTTGYAARMERQRSRGRSMMQRSVV